jgi:hypothetical protein
MEYPEVITVTVRSVGGDSYRPQQLQMELGLGKTQFTKWVKALGMYRTDGRKHFYSAEERAQLLKFRSLLNQHKSLESAYAAWSKQISA